MRTDRELGAGKLMTQLRVANGYQSGALRPFRLASVTPSSMIDFNAASPVERHIPQPCRLPAKCEALAQPRRRDLSARLVKGARLCADAPVRLPGRRSCVVALRYG